jgi:hypothetical protein
MPVPPSSIADTSFTAALMLTAIIAVLSKTCAWIWQLRTRDKLETPN